MTPVQEPEQRECGMMTISGEQGVGKTYLNMHIYAKYIQDKIETRVKGRKVLLFDTNGEYTPVQFEKNGIPNFKCNRIRMSDIADWCRTDLAECRRVDAKSLTIAEKKKFIEYILKVYSNGMLGLEDINTYILDVTHMEEIVGGLVNLRHRGVDVMISYQSLRAVEPRIFANSRWIRMHHQADNVSDIKGKVPNMPFLKIAQLLVNKKFRAGDKRFYVTLQNIGVNKIEGEYTREDLVESIKQYLAIDKKLLREHMAMNSCSMDEAYQETSATLFDQYYGNE